MNPVWVLSVDLQTKTASFQSGLGDAARAARGAFTDIKSGGSEMGRDIGYNMGEARHSVMFLADEFGVHMPRALAGFIASLGPVGAAMEAAFPFLAIVVGATMIIEHLAKMHEAGEKLTEDQAKFAIAVQSAFNALDEKLIQAQIRSDELSNDHLGALRKQLDLIDRQSMDDLIKQFDDLAKSADGVLNGLKVSWYQLGIGSDGAKHALTEFQLEYATLLKAGKAEEAGGLLKGTLAQAERVLEMQKQAKANDGGLLSAPGPNADISAAIYAENELKKSGVGFTKQEIASQEALVQTLRAQVEAEGKIADIKKQQEANAKTTAGNEASARASAAAKESADSMARLGAQAIAADRATADAQLAIKHASVEERLASDVDFANRERDMQLAANAAQMSALDKAGKDYANQLKALKDKALEIESQNATTVTQLRAKASVEANARDLAAMEQSIREQVAATQQGTAERLAAIDAGLRMEEARNQQDSNFYRELLTQRVQAARQSAEEEARVRAEMGKIEADYEMQNGALILVAQQQAIALSESLSHVSVQRRISDQTQAANLEFQLKQAALEKEINALDKSGKDYETKLRALQSKEKLLVQQHENELTNIKVQAEMERNQRIQAAESQFQDTIARGLTQSIMGHQTWGQMMSSIGDQVASGMMQNAIKSVLANDFTKESDAAYAARQAFKTGMGFPPPINLVMAPVLAAGAFAAVMAFERGGIVPGVGAGDIVPAMLTPGEGIVPKGVMDGLSNVARNGGFERGGPTNHILMHNTFHVNTIDGDGMQEALEKHTDQLERHFQKVVRRMNQ